MKKIFKLIISIIVCQLAGFIGSIFTTPAISSWYVSLTKPFFNPPNWIFAPVWTILFLLMGISLYLIWVRDINKFNKKITFGFFSIQLILNVLWSILFFGLRNPFLAFLEIIVLWFFILLTILAFYKIDKRAAYLLIPYILWVSFAAFLNLFLWVMN